MGSRMAALEFLDLSRIPFTDDDTALDLSALTSLRELNLQQACPALLSSNDK